MTEPVATPPTPGPFSRTTQGSPRSLDQAQRLGVEFVGSGSEYFRIWIVNLLLTLITLGLYYPWAKVRRLRYFYGSTLVGGEPLDFHGDPKKMLRGFLLVAVLFGLYSMAGNVSSTAGFVAFLLVAAIWPALLKSSMQFRLANTSWRGMRFRFMGSVADAYRAVLPLFLPSVVMLGALEVAGDNPQLSILFFGAAGVMAVVAVLGAPWLFWNLKRYQHNHYGLATLQTTFKATPGSFYLLFLKAIGLAVLAAALGAGLVAWGSSTSAAEGWRPSGPASLLVLAPVALMFASMALLGPYVTARLQNVVWTKTGNSELRFRSVLKARQLVALNLKNWLLMVCTIGLYWPFATVAMARLRLQAVRVETRDDPQNLINLMRFAEGDAVGDAAGDLLDIDIGL